MRSKTLDIFRQCGFTLQVSSIHKCESSKALESFEFVLSETAAARLTASSPEISTMCKSAAGPYWPDWKAVNLHVLCPWAQYDRYEGTFNHNAQRCNITSSHMLYCLPISILCFQTKVQSQPLLSASACRVAQVMYHLPCIARGCHQ